MIFAGKQYQIILVGASILSSLSTTECRREDMCNPSDPAAQCSQTATLLQAVLRVAPSGPSGPCNPCNIFVTALVNTPVTDFNGVAAADGRCMADTSYPGTGTYKAMLAAAGVRIACTTANCSGGATEHTDWVLRPGTAYRRLADGAPLMTTNADGIYNFSTAMTTAFATGVAGWWTGLGGNWVLGSACTGNTWTSSGGSGNFGDPNMTTSGAISNGMDPCSTVGSKLVCVQQ